MANLLPGCRLVEFDFSGIEAVLSGWFMRDPVYIHLATLGVHAGLASHVLKRPYDARWPDAEIAAYFHQIKKADPVLYDRCKRTVHGCLPGDHEVLTPDGWLPLRRLREGTPVAQWEQGGVVSFVLPSKITRSQQRDAEPLTELDGRGLQIQMTADHRVPVRIGQREAVQDVPVRALRRTGRIPVTGNYEGGGIAWSPQLALLVAGQADGCYEAGRWTFHLVRPRKITRLRTLLQAAGVAFTDAPCKCHPHGHRIRFKLWADRWLTGQKVFRLPIWLQLSPVARDAFLQEVLLWDGTQRANGNYKVYLTTQKVNAVVVQTLLHLAGRQGLLRAAKRCGFSGNILYSVSFNQRRWARVETCKRRTTPKPSTVYCVTVPSSYFLVRWRDTISVTGNTNYGLTEFGMVRNFPETFPTLAIARKFKAAYAAMAPGLPTWHAHLRELAYKQNFLGGPGAHPFGYKHWFWSVLGFRGIPYSVYLKRQRAHEPVTEIQGKYFAITLGDDAKRCVAFFPQSTAAGVLKEVMLRLFDPEHPSYIGDAYYGRTPFRAPIHDSLLLEIPLRVWDRVVEVVFREMLRPIPELPLGWVAAEDRRRLGLGESLSIGVEAKQGMDWATMTGLAAPTAAEVGVSGDQTYFPAEDTEDEADTVQALGTAVA